MNESMQLVWHPEQRAVSELKNWKQNPRKITKEGLTKLKERIVKRGFHDVIKIDTDNTVLSGNQRKKALVELGITEVAVLVPNRKLSEDERNTVALESNTNDGQWDFEALKSFEIEVINDIGFDDVTLGNIFDETLETKDDEFNIEKEIAKIKEPKTKHGDLIIMGPHKLICGSATDPAVLKRLFGLEKASMIYSDPPYNINVDYNGGIGGKQNYGGNVIDDRTDVEYADFIRSTIIVALSVAKDDVHCFYWCDETYIWLMQTLYRELGITNKRVCLWIKNSQNPTPTIAFNKCYEPCTYGVRGKPHIAQALMSFNEVMNKELTTGNALIDETDDELSVWTAKRLSSKDYTHATAKPPNLHEKAIRRCTQPGDIILDSFSGSASTIVAAHQLKRRVFAVELEPVFCDLAIQRFELLTGLKAEIIHSDEEK